MAQIKENKMKRLLLTAYCLMMLIGCVSVNVIPLGGAEFYPTDANVLVYYNRDNIEKPYDEIAILNAKTTDKDFVSDEKMLNALLLKAKEIGADAVIYESQSTKKGGPMVLIGGMLAQDTHGSFRVIAIRYK